MGVRTVGAGKGKGEVGAPNGKDPVSEAKGSSFPSCWVNSGKGEKGRGGGVGWGGGGGGGGGS